MLPWIADGLTVINALSTVAVAVYAKVTIDRGKRESRDRERQADERVASLAYMALEAFQLADVSAQSRQDDYEAAIVRVSVWKRELEGGGLERLRSIHAEAANASPGTRAAASHALAAGMLLKSAVVTATEFTSEDDDELPPRAKQYEEALEALIGGELQQARAAIAAKDQARRIGPSHT